MANHASAKKRIRQIGKRTIVNRNRIGRIRTYVRKVEEAIVAGDAALAQAAFREAQPEMMRGVTKGVLHRNTVSRKISRLAKRIKILSA
ncbi:MAG: 30S ribosomal protein S20 [Rhodospirillales bacterium]|jgi:small subunit ribosomal protein S20